MKHVVRQGECLPSIAARYGFAWNTLWEHPGNAALKERRKTPTVLFPGDEVEIPEALPASASAATGASASFVVPGMQLRLRLRLTECGRPLAGVAFVVRFEATKAEGTTDGAGMLEVALPRDAKRATLALQDRQAEITLLVGALDPVTELAGQQARLRNLGFYDGDADGEPSAALRWALRDFQRTHGLEETGEGDRTTRDTLVEAHGC